MDPRTRSVFVLLFAIAVAGCAGAAVESADGRGDGGSDPSPAIPPLTFDYDRSDEPQRARADTVRDPHCPRMPTFGLAQPWTRRGFDWDSIRALEPATRDSLAAAGALPRTDSLVVFGGASGVVPMPTVELDSAGYPIRVAPLCGSDGGRR